MSNLWSSDIKVAGRKQDIDSLCQIFAPAMELCAKEAQLDDSEEAWSEELAAIHRELGIERYPQNILSLSNIERLSDEVFTFCAFGGVPIFVSGLMQKFPQLYVAYTVYCQGGTEGRWVYDKEERFFKSGYAVNGYSELFVEDEYWDKLREKAKAFKNFVWMDREKDELYLEMEKKSAEVKGLVKQLDPNYDLVCHTMEELLQELGKRNGRYLTEEEWKAKGIYFEKVEEDEITVWI